MQSETLNLVTKCFQYVQTPSFREKPMPILQFSSLLILTLLWNNWGFFFQIRSRKCKIDSGPPWSSWESIILHFSISKHSIYLGGYFGIFSLSNMLKKNKTKHFKTESSNIEKIWAHHSRTREILIKSLWSGS